MSQDITIADQPPEAIQAVITVILPDGQEIAYELQPGVYTVGRDPASGIPVPENTVSRSHARLVLDSGGLLVEDLGSRNGIAVDGQRVTSLRLADGQQIRLGQARLAVSLTLPAGVQPQPADAPPPPPAGQPAAGQPAGPGPMAAPVPEEPASRSQLLRMPSRESLSRLWLWMLITLAAGSALLLLGVVQRGNEMLVGFGVFFILAHAILNLVLLHKCWQILQEGPHLTTPARTTPGKAVGFMFIPFYNYYWIFQAFWGLAKDVNQYCRLHGISGARVTEGLALTFCILWLVGSFLPAVSLVGLWLNVFIFKQIIGALDLVLQAKLTGVWGQPEPPAAP